MAVTGTTRTKRISPKDVHPRATARTCKRCLGKFSASTSIRAPHIQCHRTIPSLARKRVGKFGHTVCVIHGALHSIVQETANYLLRMWDRTVSKKLTSLKKAEITAGESRKAFTASIPSIPANHYLIAPTKARTAIL